MSVHANDHRARRPLHERGGSFSVKGIARDDTGAITSTPYVHTNDELSTDFAAQVIDRLADKAAKNDLSLANKGSRQGLRLNVTHTEAAARRHLAEIGRLS